MEHVNNDSAHGRGIYFGLSDHATVFYNNNSGYNKGTGILALVLTHPKLTDRTGNYNIFSLNGPSFSSKNNCICVFDPSLVLPLGLVVAHDNGW